MIKLQNSSPALFFLEINNFSNLCFILRAGQLSDCAKSREKPIKICSGRLRMRNGHILQEYEKFNLLSCLDKSNKDILELENWERICYKINSFRTVFILFSFSAAANKNKPFVTMQFPFQITFFKIKHLLNFNTIVKYYRQC